MDWYINPSTTRPSKLSTDDLDAVLETVFEVLPADARLIRDHISALEADITALEEQLRVWRTQATTEPGRKFQP